MSTSMTIAVCLKWITPVDGDDDRFASISPADSAALEWALRAGEAWGDDVVVITVGPAAAESSLRNALALGATDAVRIDLPLDTDSAEVARSLAAEIVGCRLVWCGDYSLDRGSGSVPAYLAARLGAAQALGIVDVSVGADGELSLLRRLDGGRRERLVARSAPGRPVVVSVEGSTARLRRASLRATLRVGDAAIPVRSVEQPTEHVAPALRPYRPRARVLPAPAGAVLDRLRLLTDASDSAGRGETVELDPSAAADRILAALAEWDDT